eukprot:Pompholyxophrys_punicea_v1_NODE_748_length_1356_cov_6.819508.p1 type:complete len:216 gc:universal NODE_748_length_1356_cov_6.819508:508-1155(+)
MRKTYFLYTFLKQFRIHQSKDSLICSLCFELDELRKVVANDDQKKRIQELEQHEILKKQFNSYLQIKKSLSPDVLLCGQDFTQVDVQDTFYQDLIIVIYSNKNKPEASPDYFHYVSQSGDKNDINFVMSAWLNLWDDQKEGIFKERKKLIIFSDGGPKHFKISGCVNFFALFQRQTGLQIEYNFYESYHGHSVCDAAAAHLKNKINVHERNNAAQ